MKKNLKMHWNGGVDLADMLVVLYRTGLKTHMWYMAFQVLDICENNEWLTYRNYCSTFKRKKIMRLKEF